MNKPARTAPPLHTRRPAPGRAIPITARRPAPPIATEGRARRRSVAREHWAESWPHLFAWALLVFALAWHRLHDVGVLG